MEHHAPHTGAAFEGYYSKFDLPSGAHLALIVSQVRKAKSKPNMVSFTYAPSGDDATKIYQKEIWAECMDQRKEGKGFILDVPDVGSIKWDEHGLAEYNVKVDEFSFWAKTTSRTPWSETSSTPESLLVNLPLPIHWHVNSLASRCDFQLSIPGHEFSAADRAGSAFVHDEKNWANSFPSAHMWLQARDGERGFCAAGGQILGMEAFLVGYRSKDINLSFRPPYAVRIAGVSPFMSYKTDWDGRRFELSLQSLRDKLVVKASAPTGTFFSLSAPFSQGHLPNTLVQSFQTTLDIKIYKSGLLSAWQLVGEDRFENASLEFGGAYYPHAGSGERFH